MIDFIRQWWGSGHSGPCQLGCTCDYAMLLKPEHQKEQYACACGKVYGTQQGLLTHQRMQKHLTTEKIVGVSTKKGIR